MKYRQGGVTTLYVIDELDEALWVPGMTCAILAEKESKLEEYFEIARLAFEYLPTEIKPRTKTDTTRMYRFLYRFDGMRLDSKIYVAMDTRGGTPLRLHITEAAYHPDRQKLKSGSFQSVPKTGRISEETTGNGYNDFYDDCEEDRANAKPGPQDYRVFFYSWIENPEYMLPGELEEKTRKEWGIMQVAYERYGIIITDEQLIWRRWKMKELSSKQDKSDTGTKLTGEQLFMQEYPLTYEEAFQSGASNIFDQDRVGKLVARPSLKIEEIEAKYRVNWDARTDEEKKILTELIEGARQLLKLGVWIWHMPDPRKQYVIGTDPSDGNGADSGSSNCWEFELENPTVRRQAAQFYGKVHPDELAQITAQMGKFYCNAYVGVENNMLTTIMFLSKIYDNYYYERKIDEKTAKRTKKLGFSTNTLTRDVIIDGFVIGFDDDAYEINSPITIREMKVFIKNSKTGKREHAPGRHDDSLFADFIAQHMVQYYPRKSRSLPDKPAGF